MEEVLADGRMTAKDASVLSTLRVQLGLDMDEALALHGRFTPRKG